MQMNSHTQERVGRSLQLEAEISHSLNSQNRVFFLLWRAKVFSLRVGAKVIRIVRRVDKPISSRYETSGMGA